MQTKEDIEIPVTCANCGAKPKGDYCHKCGEKYLKRSDFALSKFLKDAFRSFTHLDSKLFRSLFLLMFKPGFLTAEYLKGKRKPYLKPLALFLIINALYFFTISYNGMRTYETPLHLQKQNPYQSIVVRMTEHRLKNANAPEIKTFEIAFNERNHSLSKSMLLLLVPLLAIALALIYFRKQRYFGEHLITALHFFALMLILNMILGIFCRGSLVGTLLYLLGFQMDMSLIAEFIEPLFWLWGLSCVSLKTAYSEPWRSVLFHSFTFSLLFLPLLLCYRFIVFLATFYSI
jgi:hypothetical protein